MDKIHILEMIERYDGQSVHIYTTQGDFHIGQLNVRTSIDAGLDVHRDIEIGWRQTPIEIQDVLEIHPV
jgi:hypothetical protein